MQFIQQSKDAACARLASSLSGYVFGVSQNDLYAPTRGVQNVSLARQVAMYLTHVSFGLSLARVANAFLRDRSTVAYACHLIEDKRDDPAFDDMLEALESAARAAPAPVTDI
ncbi:helix-turn-helix domain-containing protein [Hirschia baltica]|uniref:Chromosomal replication initiator DnaA domain n=1 Tax=Hirschia baltica (strain ATCC 49814 / DSM 5838 / IFAM 1418) TaxID=582402 RepID=C6XI96_HIRBI|nr:helix-turn-helix domain-containing protein [Hirschia baltica]ACT58922.1 Chromosomal replication initiator DnaA domain [Hirschia baltica ATCC 49814]